MSKLYVFATYWNEIEWIELSLKQMEMMNPYKIVICDGCYDDAHEIHSTDGTYEKIKEFVKKHDNAILIEPIRRKKSGHIWNWLKEFKIRAFWGKIYYLYLILRCNKYRINQAATFNYMIKESGIEENDWFTSYDCDQFYSDKLIEMVNNLDKYEDFDIIVGRENTFFNSFSLFTDNYELRDYNNMPHRFYRDVCFIPTRIPVRNIKGVYKVYSDVSERKVDSGNMYHYRIKSIDRINAGYSLGDRKPPVTERTKCKAFEGKHPDIIERYLNCK